MGRYQGPTLFMENPKLPLNLIINESGAAAASPAMALASNDAYEPWFDSRGGDYGYCVEGADGYEVRVYGLGSFHFRRHCADVQGTPEPGVELGAFCDAFWRQVVPFILLAHSWEVLHASGLVVGGVCAALCGRSQMGKSTLAQAWRRRGGLVYADDAVPFRVEANAVTICPIPFRIRLRPASLSFFGAGRPAMGKQTELEFPDPRLEGNLLRAVYTIERRSDEDGPVFLEPLQPVEALRSLLGQACSLTLQDRSRNRDMLGTYMTLANAVPTFRLSYPTGLHHVDAILDRLASHTAGPPWLTGSLESNTQDLSTCEPASRAL